METGSALLETIAPSITVVFARQFYGLQCRRCLVESTATSFIGKIPDAPCEPVGFDAGWSRTAKRR
ncbi:MAG: hypothetical protein ACK4S3_09485 [Parvibaculum sp.]